MRIAMLLIALLSCAPTPSESAWEDPLIQTSSLAGAYTLPAGDTHDQPLPNTRIQVTPHASGSRITGVSSSMLYNGSLAIITNMSATVPLTLGHENTGSQPAHRITLPFGADFEVPPGESITLLWDNSTLGHFHVLSYPLPEPSPAYVEPELVVSTPSRALGAVFQPSTTRPTEVHYSVRIVSTASLSGGAVGRVELRSDASNPPTTVRARVGGGVEATLTIGLNVTDTAEGELSYTVPPGHYVLLQDVDETGSPAQTITTQSEITL